MNKYLAIGAGVLIVLVAAWALLSNNQTTKTIQTSPSPITVTSSPSVNTQADEKMVNLTKAGFAPNTLKVKVGTKVVWTNKSQAMGNISSDPHPIHTLWPFLNLGNFEDGASVSAIFDKTGTHTYHNHLNPIQTGEVVVE